MFRIQKLLSYEYSDFEESVLVESPFAQVTETGIGIKEVQIALTCTKLIIAHDTFDNNKCQTFLNVFYDRQDPETECMELTSMFPLEFLYIKVFRKGPRQLMKVSVGTTKVLWFEFGGHLLRSMYWNIWRDRIQLLRANQGRVSYIERPPSSTSISSTWTSSTMDVIPEPVVVRADVHRENLNLSAITPIISPTKHQKYPNNATSSAVKDLMGSYKLFSRSDKRDRNSACHRHDNSNSLSALRKTTDQEVVLREVAEYFLETQSDIVIGQHTFGWDSCDGSHKDFLFRSASFANLNNYLAGPYDRSHP